jgi:hypothetical protein
MQRYKRIFGNTMKARALPQQKTEAWASAFALNKMTSLGGCPRIRLSNEQPLVEFGEI